MSDLGKAYVQIVPSAEGIKGSITKVLSGESEDAGKRSGETIGRKIKDMIIAAGIGAAIKSAISEGAALEQSYIGGLETLYGSAADMARDYARAAAEAGISANSYAEQAVSFGAALKSALGDETKAADAANTAILDMADNAAKMGTDISAIQNAYQGFAKQNYTMLDNLKLGYGGTKTEMERLLADASKLEAANGRAFDINNLADVYDAIHLIQGELGLTGVAADEATTTLSGSFNAMKSAAQNFMGYLVIGEDLKPALSNLVTSASTFLFGNLVPAVGNIVSSLPGVIGEFITSTVPMLLQNGTDILNNITEGVVNNIPNFASKSIDMISSFLDLIKDNLGQFISAGITLIETLTSGFAKNLPTFFRKAPELIGQFVSLIVNNLPQILKSGWNIVKSLVEGLLSALPEIVSVVPKLISSIWDKINKTNWLDLGRNIIQGIANGLSNAGNLLLDAARAAARNALNAIKNALGIHSPSRVFRDQVGKMIDMGLAEGITDNVGYIQDSMKRISAESVVGFDTNLVVSNTGNIADNRSIENTDNVLSAIAAVGSSIVNAVNNKDSKVVLSVNDVRNSIGNQNMRYGV